MPRFDDNTIICGRSDNDCVNRVTELLKLKTNDSFQCECLPGCFAINYDTEMSFTKLIAGSPLLQFHRLHDRNAAIVHVYYKGNSFRSQRKDELIGFTEFLCEYSSVIEYNISIWIKLTKMIKWFNCVLHFGEFIANTGGLLGLFMGFSVISISELFYFMTIRPCCNYLRLSDERRRTIQTMFGRVRRLRQKKQPIDNSKKIAIKTVESAIFPYVD